MDHINSFLSCLLTLDFLKPLTNEPYLMFDTLNKPINETATFKAYILVIRLF